MAIDTQEKRASASNDGMPWDDEGFFPDGVMTQADRQDATQTYRGLLAGISNITKLLKDWWWTT